MNPAKRCHLSSKLTLTKGIIIQQCKIRKKRRKGEFGLAFYFLFYIYIYIYREREIGFTIKTFLIGCFVTLHVHECLKTHAHSRSMHTHALHMGTHT